MFRIIQIIRNSHEEIRSRRGFPLWIGLRVELEGFVGCKDSMSRPTEGSWVRLPQRPRPPTPRLRISQTTAFAGTLPYRREGNGSGLFRHSDEMIARPRLGLGCGARFDIGSRSTSGTVLPPPTVSPSISGSDVRAIATCGAASLAPAVAGIGKGACPCPVSPTSVDSSLLQRGDRRRQLAGGDVEPADGEIQSVVLFRSGNSMMPLK